MFQLTTIRVVAGVEVVPPACSQGGPIDAHHASRVGRWAAGAVCTQVTPSLASTHDNSGDVSAGYDATVGTLAQAESIRTTAASTGREVPPMEPIVVRAQSDVVTRRDTRRPISAATVETVGGRSTCRWLPGTSTISTCESQRPQPSVWSASARRRSEENTSA